ncbi:MAG: DMT family transporter [Dongiaceae bacterium]
MVRRLIGRGLAGSGRGGIVLALASALLFGASTPLAKLLLGSVDPWLLAGLLYLGSGGGLLLVRMLRRGGGGEAPLRRADLPWLAGAIAAGGVAGPLLLLLGLARGSAAATALLLNLEGLATLAIAWLAFREPVDRRLLAGAFAILAGAALLAWPAAGGLALGWGAVLVAAACLAWGIDNNLTRKVAAADPVTIALLKGLAAGAVNGGLALAGGAALPPPGALAAALLVGFLGYGVSLVLFVLALRQLGTARTGAYYATAPFIGAALAVLLLGEPATPLLLAAGALMAVGVYLHLAERHEHDHDHQPVEHEHRHLHDAHHAHAHAAGDPPGEPTATATATAGWSTTIPTIPTCITATATAPAGPVAEPAGRR